MTSQPVVFCGHLLRVLKLRLLQTRAGARRIIANMVCLRSLPTVLAPSWYTVTSPPWVMVDPVMSGGSGKFQAGDIFLPAGPAVEVGGVKVLVSEGESTVPSHMCRVIRRSDFRCNPKLVVVELDSCGRSARSNFPRFQFRERLSAASKVLHTVFLPLFESWVLPSWVHTVQRQFR